jgi:NAD(P)-dependent dehydrogenase (short-subunit alcohol dehydrogenase family)
MSRRALVTGASSGIGAAIAQRLLREGWTVAGISRSRPEFEHDRFTFVPADLAEGYVEIALDGVGPVDALVHAAGVLRVGPLEQDMADDARAMWRLHVEATSELVRWAVPAMPTGGRVVLIGSRVADGAAGRSQYAATKAAMVGLARSWAAELAPRGITVNVVAPGATDTPMLRDPARSTSAPKLPPLGRFVQPEEVAGLVAFLLSADGASITGQQLVVCGGASL